MKVVTILGARPQFIKAAAVSKAISDSNSRGASAIAIEEVIVHTGQHFHQNMSEVFFAQLGVPAPQFNLGVSGLGHGAMTGRMMESIERVLVDQRPDWVLVYGDTNSTLAGALAAVKLGVPVAHVEAGLRSNNADMPEEVNRVLTDRFSTALFCPTQRAAQNLMREGFPFPVPGRRRQVIEQVGDVMFDLVQQVRAVAEKSVNLGQWGVDHRGYALCTIHRQENTDCPDRFGRLLGALRKIACQVPVILPLHPRTRQRLGGRAGSLLGGVMIVDPLPYLEMQRLLMSARFVLTDSGGVQKESFFHRVPCITIRDETEWTETVDVGWNVVVGTDPERLSSAVDRLPTVVGDPPPIFGTGRAAQSIVRSLVTWSRA